MDRSKSAFLPALQRPKPSCPLRPSISLHFHHSLSDLHTNFSILCKPPHNWILTQPPSLGTADPPWCTASGPALPYRNLTRTFLASFHGLEEGRNNTSISLHSSCSESPMSNRKIEPENMRLGRGVYSQIIPILKRKPKGRRWESIQTQQNQRPVVPCQGKHHCPFHGCYKPWQQSLHRYIGSKSPLMVGCRHLKQWTSQKVSKTSGSIFFVNFVCTHSPLRHSPTALTLLWNQAPALSQPLGLARRKFLISSLPSFHGLLLWCLKRGRPVFHVGFRGFPKFELVKVFVL